MARPPETPYTGPTQRLPRRAVHTAPGRAPQRPRSRRATCGIAFVSTLIIGLLILLVGGFWLWSRFKQTTAAVKFDPPTIAAQQGSDQGGVAHPTPDIVKEPFNVLLIGVDTREADLEEGARSDTLIVVHVDPQNKWASMLSIPRDNCAPIPGKTAPGECDKINSAYSYGYKNPQNASVDPDESGASVARAAVNEYLGLNQRGQMIDYVVQVDFNGFKDIIDAIGGININVQRPLMDSLYPTDDGDYGVIRLYIPAGYQHMDGVTALRYARSRHTTTDYGRAERQQQVIEAILTALKEKGLLDQIGTLNELANQLHNTFRTNLPIDEISSLRALAGLASDLTQGGRISSYTLGPFDTVIGGKDAYTPLWAPEDIEARVDEWLMGPASISNNTSDGSAAPADPALKVEVLNGASINGLASEVTSFLEEHGYRVNQPSTASTVYDESMIIDYGEHSAERRRLATLLGIKPKNIVSADDSAELPSDPTTDLVLLLGRDYKESWRGGQ